MRWALAFVAVGIAAGCGAGTSGPSDSGAPDAPTTGELRLRWAISVDGLQGFCRAGWEVLAWGAYWDGTDFAGFKVRAPCQAWTMAVELPEGPAYAHLLLFDAQGDALAITDDEWYGIVAGGTVDEAPRILRTTTEPEAHLRRIADGAIAYYEANGVFPPSSDDTPALGTCCVQPEGICVPTSFIWTLGPWPSLAFAPLDHFRMHYRFLSEEQAFVVRASGDSDCDAVYTTHELRGEVDPLTGAIDLGEITVMLDDNGFP